MLVTDIDGCVLDWHSGFIEFCSNYGHEINPESDQSTYNMSKWFYNMTTEQMVQLIEEFNSQCRGLQPYPDCAEYLPKIAEKFDVIALTAFGECREQAEERKKYLNQLFPGVFKDVIVLPLNSCKQSELDRLKSEYNITYFVEDSIDHARSGAQLGIPTILIDKSYNQGEVGNVNRLISDSPWRTIHQILTLR